MQVETLARQMLKNPIEIQVGGRSVVNSDITQVSIRCKAALHAFSTVVVSWSLASASPARHRQIDLALVT